MKFGLSEAEFSLINKLIIVPFKTFKIKAWVFGSRARGDHQKFSDIDILYQIPKGTNLPISFIAQIKSQVEDSTLPFKVDFVDIDFLAESYKQSVMKDRTLLT